MLKYLRSKRVSELLNFDRVSTFTRFVMQSEIVKAIAGLEHISCCSFEVVDSFILNPTVITLSVWTILRRGCKNLKIDRHNVVKYNHCSSIHR